MQPRHLTGHTGVFFAGVRLRSLAAAVFFLVGVVFAPAAWAAGNVIQYQYDAAGNIKRISRTPTGQIAITGFSPASGAVGTAVTIYGMGFSTTPANNTVKFNGTTATVTASDAGSIATTVPSGATTGKITVTIGATTVTSAQDFTVTVAGAPTVASFTPAIGPSGTSVSLTGTGFNASAGATTFKLNGVTATGSASSTTAASVTIPASASSGRISATTSVGTGSSTSDFVVPPTGLVAGDIENVARISAGGAAGQARIGSPNRAALVLFDGTLDTFYSLHFTSLELSPTTGTMTYKVIKPDNSVLLTGSMLMTQPHTVHLPRLPATGTYTLQLGSGAATLNTLVRLEQNPVLTLDGVAVATNQDYPSQTSRFIFTATAGQRIGLGVLGLSAVPSTSAIALKYQKEDSGETSRTCFTPNSDNLNGNCGVEFLAASAGTYFITLGQLGYRTTASVQISSPLTGALTKDVTQTGSLTRVGQHTAYTFTASAGDNVAANIFAATGQSPQATNINLSVIRPDGSTHKTCNAKPPSLIYCEMGTIATAGTYTMVAEPDNGAYGSFSIAVKSGPALVTTNAPSSFASSASSEVVRGRFTASAGDNLSIGLAGITANPAAYASFTVYSPSGADLGGANCNNTDGACRASYTNLAAGTYGIAVRPPAGSTLSGTWALSADLTGSLTVGTPASLNVTRQGQRATYTFSATAGDNVAFEVYGLSTTPSGRSVTVTIYKPDGGYYNGFSTTGTAYLHVNSLPATGTYKVTLDSEYGSIWQGQVAVDAGVTTSIDASTISLSSTAGQPLRYRFSGTSGDRLDFGISGLTYAASSSNGTEWRIYRPDGNSWSGNCSASSAGSCDNTVTSLPSTGTYVLMLKPPAASSITAGTLALSTPQSGTFTIGNPAQTIALSRPGQTARYTFSGTAAQTLRLNWSSVTVAGTGNVSVTVLNPSGGTVSSSSFVNGASSGLDIAALPSTGTYTVVLDPASGSTMSGSFSLVTR